MLRELRPVLVVFLLLTLLTGNIGPQSIAYSLFRNLPYRPEQLQPVSNMIRGPNVLVLHPAERVCASDFSQESISDLNRR